MPFGQLAAHLKQPMQAEARRSGGRDLYCLTKDSSLRTLRSVSRSM